MPKRDPDEPEELAVIFKKHAQSPTGIRVEEIKKWMKQGKLIDDETDLQDADVDQTFEAVAKGKTELDLVGFREFILSLSSAKNMQKKEVLDKLVAAGKPKD